MLCVTIKPVIGMLSPQAVIFQYVQHPCHLAEDEDTGALLLEPREELIQYTHLATINH